MTTPSSLTFKVKCSACYGEEMWKFERIVRTLTAVGKLPEGFEQDIEYVAKQFIDHSKQMVCVGCGKTGLISVYRVAS